MRLSTSLPALLTAVSLVLPGLAFADDASVCNSLCTSTRKECRARVPLAVDLDRTLKVGNTETNPHARVAGQAQPVAADARVRDRSEYESRRTERNGMCDDSYNRCVRSCASPAAAAGTSEVLTRQGRERPAVK